MELYTGVFSHLKTYRDIKEHFDTLGVIEKIYNSKFCMSFAEADPDGFNYWQEETKKACRQVYRNYSKRFDLLSVPVTNSKGQWRTVLDDDGEGGKDFIILPLHDMTEEEIKQFVYDTVYCETGVDFDCSGRKFTQWFDWTRQPCGIAIVHSWAIDI